MQSLKVFVFIFVAWFNFALAESKLTHCPVPSNSKGFQLYALKNAPTKSDFDESCMPCTQPDKDNGIIAFSKYWKIVLNFNQQHLGRALIISCRHFGSYEDMTPEEARDYDKILRALLPAIKKAFDVTHFNVEFLMNQAYRDKSSKPADPPLKNNKPNPHFHWHVVPRYNGERIFLNEKFDDPNYGDPLPHTDKRKMVNDEFKAKIISEIRKNLNIRYVSHYKSHKHCSKISLPAK